jgi:hypothetical protein
VGAVAAVVLPEFVPAGVCEVAGAVTLPGVEEDGATGAACADVVAGVEEQPAIIIAIIVRIPMMSKTAFRFMVILLKKLKVYFFLLL